MDGWLQIVFKMRFPLIGYSPRNRMRINRLIKRNAATSTRIEPVATGHDVASGDSPHTRDRINEWDPTHAYDSPGDYKEDLRGSNAVYGLIGTFVPSGDGMSQRDRAGFAAGVDDLIEALHEQYCRVLDDPHASLADNWAGQATPAGGPSAGEGYEPSAGAHAPHNGSIEALLSGSRFMEDAFGPLVSGDVTDLAATEPVPEILRLFAPTEYRSTASRRPPPLPPALARREHHSLGIDSPLPAPDSTTRHEVQ